MLTDKDHRKIVEALRKACGTMAPPALETSGSTPLGKSLTQCSDILQDGEVVVAPLFSACGDAYELLNDLRSAGFAGQVVVIAKDIPNLSLIARDLAQVAGDVEFDIVDITNTLQVTLH